MITTDDALTPTPEHRFTFGLGTVGNPGRDPFGGPTREPVDPVDSVPKLAELGAWGVSLHDEDLVPPGSPPAERDKIAAMLNFDMVGSPNFVRFVYDGDLSDSEPPDGGAPPASAEIEDLFLDYFEEQGLERREALRRMLALYTEHMDSNEPVHTWPLP